MSAWIAGAIGAVSGSVLTAILLCLCRDSHHDKRDVKANKWGRDGDRWEGLSPEVRLFAPAALPPGVWKNRFDRSARKWNEDLED